MQFNDKFNVQFQGEAIFGNLERKTTILFSRSRDEGGKENKFTFFLLGIIYLIQTFKTTVFRISVFQKTESFTPDMMLKMEYRF
jgi:hypothetical protein